MTDSHNVTIWDGLTLGLWSFFFIIGLAPEWFFHGFRTLSGVTAQHAVINSSGLITVGFSAYFAFFVARQCRQGGLSDSDAQGKAIHVGIIAMIAFLELPSRSAIFGTQTLVYLMVQSSQIDDAYLRNVLLLVGSLKLVAWLYLFSLIIRFHLMGRRHTFSRMPSFFGTHHTTPSNKRKISSNTPPPGSE